MSLIPSESLNFPDGFRANIGWRLFEKSESEQKRAPNLEWRRRSETETKPAEPNGSTPAEPAEQGPSKPAVAAAPPLSPQPGAAVEKHAEPEPKQAAAPAIAPVSDSTVAVPAPEPAQSPVEAADVPVETHQSSPENVVPEATNPTEPSLLQVSNPGVELLRQLFGAVPMTMVSSPSEGTTPDPTHEPSSTGSSAASPDLKASTETAPAPALAEPMSDSPLECPSDPASPVPIETPAQPQHILELIAAAVQRGALIGEADPQPEVSAASPGSSAPVVTEITSNPPPQPGPAAEMPLPVSSSPVPTAASSSTAAKTPAKIRITPRKIKPRAPVQVPTDTAPATPPTFAADELESARARWPQPTFTKPEVAEPHVKIVPIQEQVIRKAQPVLQIPLPKNPPPRFAAGQPDLLLFTTRERRNRWIGFGLSEAVALIALLLLTRFGFTYHFADPTLKLLIFILIFAVGAVAVAIPIAFIRNSPERWQRRA